MSATFDEVYQNYKEYDGIWIPGGRAPEYLRMNPQVIEIVKYFLESGKPLAAICHGAQILVACGGIQGRKISCYPAQEVELKLAGAQYAKCEWDESVVDGKIISGPAWSANPAVLTKFIDALGFKITYA